MKYLVPFHCNDGYKNAPQCNTLMYIAYVSNKPSSACWRLHYTADILPTSTAVSTDWKKLLWFILDKIRACHTPGLLLNFLSPAWLPCHTVILSYRPAVWQQLQFPQSKLALWRCCFLKHCNDDVNHSLYVDIQLRSVSQTETQSHIKLPSHSSGEGLTFFRRNSSISEFKITDVFSYTPIKKLACSTEHFYIQSPLSSVLIQLILSDAMKWKNLLTPLMTSAILIILKRLTIRFSGRVNRWNILKLIFFPLPISPY